MNTCSYILSFANGIKSKYITRVCTSFCATTTIFVGKRYGFLFETQNNLYVFLYVNEDFLRVSRCRGVWRCNSTLYII